jgi:DEP domain-containing protein 5
LLADRTVLLVSVQHVHSGLITGDTRFVFRSRSAKMFMYIQMSKEMMEYGDDGLLYYERAVSVFLPELFARWKEIGASHSLYIA